MKNALCYSDKRYEELLSERMGKYIDGIWRFRMKHKLTRFACLAVTGAVLFSGCGAINANATLVKITNDGKTDSISLGYGNFAARYTQALYDSYYGTYLSDDMWSEDLYGNGNTMEVDTKDEVMDQIEEEYLCKVHASDYDVELSEDQTKAIDEAAESFISDNKDNALEEMGATKAYVTDFLTYRTYASLVKEKVEAEAEGKIEISDDEINQSTFSYVKLETSTTDDSGNTTELSAEEISALSQTAYYISHSADFDAAVEAAGLTASTQSFTTAEDPAEDENMAEEIIATAQKLKEGEISNVIEIEGEGYYVLRLDSAFDEEATADKKTEVHDEKVEEYYNNLVEEWKAAITWTVDDKQWDKVKYDTLFTAAESEEEADATTEADTTEEVTDETESTDVDETESTEETSDSSETTDDSTETSDEATDNE